MCLKNKEFKMATYILLKGKALMNLTDKEYEDTAVLET